MRVLAGGTSPMSRVRTWAEGATVADETRGTEGNSAFWAVLLPALTFVAGVVLASAVFFIVDDVGNEDTAQPAATSTPASPADSEELVVQIPAACVDAAEAATSVGRVLDDLAAAVTDLNTRELQDTLDAVQTLRPQIERTSQECLDIAADARIVLPTPTPSGTGTPTATPTPTS